MKKAFLFVLMALVFGNAGSGMAAVFYVTNETALRNALSSAGSNGEHDTINITSGTYNTSGNTFTYNPAATENRSLTIVGAGVGNTILDGSDSDQIVHIETTGLTQDTKAHVRVRGITFQNGNDTGINQGGGLHVRTSQANITVEDCEFTGNTGYYGGGAYAVSAVDFLPTGNITFRNNIFSGNSADNRGGGGYAVTTTGILTYQSNIFDGNTADWSGGGAYGDSSQGIVIFINNVFNANTANQYGGGTMSYSSTGIVTFTNNTFSGNNSGIGGGGGFYISLFWDSATANIYNNIAWDNMSTGDGDDIYVDDDGNGDLTAARVYFYNNDYGPGPDPEDFYIEVGGENLSQGGNINTDPLFVDPASGDFHLWRNSPCVDEGKNSAQKLPDTDFEGDPRRIDGDNDGKRKVDIGADEYGPIKVVAPNGREVIPAGSNYVIEWIGLIPPPLNNIYPLQGPPQAGNFTLKYSMDNGIEWKLIESGLGSPGYDWTVPTPTKNKTKCLVKVIEYSGSERLWSDRSNSTFTIEVLKVTSPNGGELLTSGDKPIITWTTHETKRDVARVILKYTINGGRTWKKIATLDGNPGSYNEWTVPDVPKTKSKCKVKVVLKDAAGNTVGNDTSDSSFTIEPGP